MILSDFAYIGEFFEVQTGNGNPILKEQLFFIFKE
jgi:hypothetical protein